MSQLTVDQAIQLALQHQQANQLAEAEEIFRQILTAFPDQADALHLLGGVYLQAKRTELAEQRVRQAIQIRPEPTFYLTLDVILQEQKRYEEALDVCRHLIARQPDHAEAYVHQGVVLSILGRFEEAARAFQETIRLAPGHVQAQGNLGIVLCHLKRYEEAVWILKSALAKSPNSADFRASLGAALQGTGQSDAALQECKKALEQNPNQVQALTMTSFILRSTGKAKEAVDPARKAALLLPQFIEVQINCGECLREAELPDDAIDHYERVIDRKMVSADLHNNLGNVYKDQSRLEEAMAEYRKALAISASPHVLSNLVFTLHYHPAYTPEMIFKELQVYDNTFVKPLQDAVRRHTNEAAPDRRLRIGYISSEFRQHALGLYMVPLMENHDKSQFEIFCYAAVTKPDFYTFRHRQWADHWRDINEMDAEQIADIVRRDRIDILIDLHQHMGGNRMPVFARKPAPVQIGFAGYPNTSGVSSIDYRLTDPYLEPPGEPPFPTAETVMHLPHTWWCYHPPAEVPVSDLPMLTAGHVTFGNLNNFCKLNDQTFALWAQIMRAVERSRLLLLAPEGSHRDRLLATMNRHGISADRISFLKRVGPTEYYHYYHQIDLGLDSFPYNGHTTSMDSFWMGVPVMSYAGPAPWSRGTWSQASNLGLTDLVGRTPDEFVQRAIALAKDPTRLAEIRCTLRERMKSSPLMDGKGFARGIEACYRQAWKNWCATP